MRTQHRTRIAWALSLLLTFAAVALYAESTPVPTVPAASDATPADPSSQDSASAETPQYPAGAEIAVILAKNRFHPSEIRVRSGVPSTLVFATVNKKPAALIVEPLAIQRWIASESNSMDRAQPNSEITREVNSERVTIISFDPKPGRYRFHDALSGARGEIFVE